MRMRPRARTQAERTTLCSNNVSAAEMSRALMVWGPKRRCGNGSVWKVHMVLTA